MSPDTHTNEALQKQVAGLLESDNASLMTAIRQELDEENTKQLFNLPEHSPGSAHYTTSPYALQTAGAHNFRIDTATIETAGAKAGEAISELKALGVEDQLNTLARYAGNDPNVGDAQVLEALDALGENGMKAVLRVTVKPILSQEIQTRMNTPAPVADKIAGIVCDGIATVAKGSGVASKTTHFGHHIGNWVREKLGLEKSEQRDPTEEKLRMAKVIGQGAQLLGYGAEQTAHHDVNEAPVLQPGASAAPALPSREQQLSPADLFRSVYMPQDIPSPRPSASSFTARLVSSRKEAVYIVKGRLQESGRHAYFMLQLFPGKKDAFQQHLEAGMVDLRDYGRILASGYGERVSQKVREEMVREYAIELAEDV